MLLYPVILASVLLTALLSGVLGMAGGMILMAILVALMPVAAAMTLHGVVQAFSNGSRAWFLREHIRWGILPWYGLGSAIATSAFAALTLVPDPALVLVLVGAMPWIARAAPLVGSSRLGSLDVSRPATAVTCGITVTIAQLLAGASGPLLDLFYLHSPLNRYQVVASKALTQTIGHLLKVGYYGVVAGSVGALPWPLYGTAILAALIGARVGTRLLDKLADDAFRRVSGWVILGLGAACVLDGGRRLIVG
jgi:uncharacterized membrane protein YfcA